MQFSLSGPRRPLCSSFLCVYVSVLPPSATASLRAPADAFPAKDRVLKCPAAVTMTTLGGGKREGKQDMKKKRKLGQSRSKPSTSSPSAGGKLQLQRVRVSVLAGQHRSLPPIRYIGRFALSTNLCFIRAGDCCDM